MNPTVKIELEVGELNAVLQVLGQLPTSSGAWPLLVKIKMQADEQVKPDEPKE
jgi:hypothetical protein